MECLLEFGMKATYLGEDQWTQSQHGREITVYIFQHDQRYNTIDDLPEQDNGFLYLGPEKEVLDETWIYFLTEAESRLTASGIEPGGCADGDRPLPGLPHASIRNEAFIRERTSDGLWGDVYPPNFCGYNAAGHRNPFEKIIAYLEEHN
jgi:hypothetical protein